MLDRFFDKDIIDFVRGKSCQDAEVDYKTIAHMQLSRDIKELIKAIRSLKAELDGEV